MELMDWAIMILALPFTLLFVWSFRRRRSRSLPLPPGPRGLPIIGNMDIMGQLTHRGLARLAQRYGGLCHLRLGCLHAVAVSTPDMARQVLQAQDSLFSNRPATAAIAYLTYDRADMAFAHYGPFWRQMRKLCVVKLFSRKRAESWASVRDEVESTVKAAAEKSGSAVNVGELVFNLTNNITFRAAFGARTSQEEQEEFIGILQEFSRLFGAFSVGDFVPWLWWVDLQGVNKRLERARRSLDRFIDRIIDDHMENPKEADDADTDMVDDMLAFLGEAGGRGGGGAGITTDDFKLSRNNIKAIIMDVMFGGTETVASAIEWAMAELMHSPDDMRRVQQELADAVGLERKVQESDLDRLPFLRCAIKETLRLHPPIPLLLHEAAEDVELAGYSVPKRSRVMINVFAIGRDRSAWKDADTFVPSRFAPGEGDMADVDFRGNFFELLPFGSGRRSCPGMQLGLHGLELAVAQLAHCFRWELPDGMKPSELDMGDVFGLTAPRAVRLVAVPNPRLSCPI